MKSSSSALTDELVEDYYDYYNQTYDSHLNQNSLTLTSVTMSQEHSNYFTKINSSMYLQT